MPLNALSILARAANAYLALEAQLYGARFNRNIVLAEIKAVDGAPPLVHVEAALNAVWGPMEAATILDALE